MSNVERVTVTLPNDLVRDIDRRQDLLGSLRNAHPETTQLAEQSLDEWTSLLPEEDTEALVDRRAGQAIRWIPGQGWVEDPA